MILFLSSEKSFSTFARIEVGDIVLVAIVAQLAADRQNISNFKVNGENKEERQKREKTDDGNRFYTTGVNITIAAAGK